MPVNKVIYGNTTVIDITDSTVTPDTLAKGKVAYDKAGNRIVGEMNNEAPKKYKHTLTINALADADYNATDVITIEVINSVSTPYVDSYPTGAEMEGVKFVWNGIPYTIISVDGAMFTTAEGDTFYFDSPGEISDEVTEVGGGSSELFVTIDDTQYPITPGMTWQDLIDSGDTDLGTDYSGGFGWSVWIDCWDCGGTEKFLDPVVGGMNGALFGEDGTFVMPHMIINPYCSYHTSYSTPDNFVLNNLV